MAAPYHLIDIYIRTALGEVMAFMFIPFVFRGMYSIYNKKKNNDWMLALGAIGLLLSHNISNLIVIMACADFVICYITKLKDW